MIRHELIFLGLLKEGPKHGYDIKRKIKEILSVFAGIELKSVYYPLALLERQGLVVKHAEKEGKRPQRFIYKLTPKGDERFRRLLSESLLKLTRPQFSLDLSLYFLNHIKPQIARRRLNARIYILKKLARTLRQVISVSSRKGTASLVRILGHNLKMVEAEIVFLSDLIKTL